VSLDLPLSEMKRDALLLVFGGKKKVCRRRKKKEGAGGGFSFQGEEKGFSLRRGKKNGGKRCRPKGKRGERGGRGYTSVDES